MELLVTGAFSLSEEEMRQFRAAGYVITIHQDERAAVDEPEKYEAVICNALFLYNPIEKFTALRLIQLTSAGKDRVPLDYIDSRQIRLFTAEDSYCIPMAEWAVNGILNIYKNDSFFAENRDKKKWEKDRTIRELFGKTVLICGFGNAGREIAKRLRAFGCYIIAADPCSRNADSADELILPDQAERRFSGADIVILTLPLNRETRHYMDKRRLSLMKHDAILVNIARGELVDEAALCDHLCENPMFSAVLDVFEEEPLAPDSRLWSFDRVIVTPHNSFIGENNRKRLYSVFAKNILNGVALK